MMVKDTISKAYADNQQSIEEIASGLATPDTAIGATFVAGASVLAVNGHTDKGKFIGWGITAFASVALATKYAMEGNYGSAVGSVIGLGTSTWLCIQAKLRMNRQNKIEQFKENEQQILSKYPAMMPSLVNIVSSSVVGVSSFLHGDYPMMGVCAAWLTGNIFNAFSAPEVQNQSLYKPA